MDMAVVLLLVPRFVEPFALSHSCVDLGAHRAQKQLSSFTPLQSQMNPNPAAAATPSHRVDIPGSRYTRNPPQPSLSAELRRGSAGEANAATRPSRPPYRPSHLSGVAYDTPRSADSAYAPSWPAQPSPISPPYTDGVESVGSATALSTVWDEVEDLKGRIERYRSSGRRVTSSGAVLEDAGDRPRTATTMTTNSTSSHPAHASRRLASSRVDSAGNKTHELLRTALSKARDRIDPNVYKSLESCASDAIAASSTLGKPGETSIPNSPISPVPSRTPTDKKVARHVDSLCRSLTELCIALMQDGNPSGTRLVESRQTERPVSRASVLPREGLGASNYLEERRVRLERIGSASRPTSSLSRHTLRQDDAPMTSLAVRQSLGRQRSRPRRLSINADSEDPHSTVRTNTMLSQVDSEDQDSTVRAPSMEMAPSQVSPRRNRQKFSRDYIDQSPLPDVLSPTLRQSLKTNQSHASLHSAYTTMTYADNYRNRDYSRETSDGRAATDLLEQRLQQRRQQQQQSVASSNQPGLIAPLSETPRDYLRPRAISASARRPQSSGRSQSRLYDR